MKRFCAVLTVFVLVALLVAAIAGCVPRSLVVGQMAALVDDGVSAWEGDADLVLVEKAMPAQIKLAETMAAAEPGNRRLLVLLSRLYGAYGLVFTQTRIEAHQLKAKLPPGMPGAIAPAEDQAEASRYFQRGADFALKALELAHPDATGRMARPETAAAFFGSLTLADVPALFWHGFNLAAYIHHNRNEVTAVSRLYLVKGAMERVIALAPDDHHGLAHLVMMVYWGALPPALGGQPLKAEDHYRQALAVTGGRLGLADAYYARYVLQPLQRRRDFTETLNAVAGNWDKDPGLRLYNRLAAVRAQLYLQATDRLFEEE